MGREISGRKKAAKPQPKPQIWVKYDPDNPAHRQPHPDSRTCPIVYPTFARLYDERKRPRRVQAPQWDYEQ